LDKENNIGIAAAFSDLDGDGDLDAILLMQNRSESGSDQNQWPHIFRYLQNVGNRVAPSFRVIDEQASPIHNLVPENDKVSGKAYISPVFSDLDGDGDDDLYSGGKFYERVGNAFETGVAITSWDVGLPAFVDLDADGDLDVVVSTLHDQTALLYYNNTGNRTYPILKKETGAANPFSTLRMGLCMNKYYPSMAWNDVDGDGDLDFFIGNCAPGNPIRYFDNTGTPTAPVFVSAQAGMVAYSTGTTGAANPVNELSGYFKNSMMTLADLDDDGDPDWIIASTMQIDSSDSFEQSLKPVLVYYRNYAVETYCFYKGTFSLPNGRCSCDIGNAGVQCDVSCPSIISPTGDVSVCSSHGACYTAGANEGSCICEPGYGGLDASNRTACNDCLVHGSSDSPSYFGSVTSGIGLTCQLW